MLCNILLFIFTIVLSFNVFQALLSIEDGYFHGMEADRIDWSNHPCNRPCLDEGKPKICHYRFVVENFMTMSKACYNCPQNITDCFRPHCLPADGNMKFVVTANRNLPGPHIQVCLGDKIVVDVKNMLEADVTTIHWHGIRLLDNPYMDGVPQITQCPILPTNTFRYQFNATQIGTYFWHSHSGGQRGDGLSGGLTIRAPPKSNPHKDLYDFDHHSMLIFDWKTLSSREFYLTTVHDSRSQSALPHTILINGFGRYKDFSKSNEEPLYTPSAVFNVRQGYRYRFRLVNTAGENCPIQMSVDNHTMTVISLDGNDIVPVEVDSIYSWPGERYDFVLNANQEINNYWFRYRGHGDLCVKLNIPVYQVAILRYESAAIKDPSPPVGWAEMPLENEFRKLNPFTTGAKSEKGINIDSLKALSVDVKSNNDVDHQFYIGYDAYRIDNYEYQRSVIYGMDEFFKKNRKKIMVSYQFDHISYKMPPIPLLPQRNVTTPDMFCNSTTLITKDCINEQCICTHMLQVKLNSVVELVVVDEGILDQANHPMHLHGHNFRVVATEKLEGRVTVDRVKQLDREGNIKRVLHDRAPEKDTMKIPSGGYSILRFYADNPGYWFFHCHFDQHADIGMALVFKVGENEDMLPVPKDFPQCGGYMPDINPAESESRMIVHGCLYIILCALCILMSFNNGYFV